MESQQSFESKFSTACESSGVTPSDIEKAAARISPHIKHTPLVRSEVVSAWIGDGDAGNTDYVFKLESLQHTGSFKFRGAVNTLAIAAEAENPPTAPVVTHSSGNHGAGVAAAAKIFGRDSFVVMPNTSFQAKRQLVQQQGANLVLCEPDMSERRKAAEKLAESNNGVAIHSQSDKNVVAGQGTIALEILKEMPDIDGIVASIGTGGLIGGIAIAAKAFNKDIKIIGVEPENCDSASKSLELGYRIEVPYDVETLADSLRASIGTVAWGIIPHIVDDVIRVSEDQIKEGLDILSKGLEGPVEGGAGATVAATRTEAFKKLGLRKVAIIVCGGNCG